MLEQVKDLSTLAIGDTLSIDYGSKNINTRVIGELRGIVDHVYVCRLNKDGFLVYNTYHLEYLTPLIQHGYLFRQVKE